MDIGVQTRVGLIVLAAGFAASVHSQVPDGPPASSQTSALVPTSAPSEQLLKGTLIREIDDPHTGDRWLLMLDPSRPGAPGRMVLAAVGADSNRQREQGDSVPRSSTHKQSIPVIHAGDRLVVEESTPLVETRLVAVALGQAVSGASFNARLAIGGNVVRVVAVSPGHAVFAQRTGGRP